MAVTVFSAWGGHVPGHNNSCPDGGSMEGLGKGQELEQARWSSPLYNLPSPTSGGRSCHAHLPAVWWKCRSCLMQFAEVHRASPKVISLISLFVKLPKHLAVPTHCAEPSTVQAAASPPRPPRDAPSPQPSSCLSLPCPPSIIPTTTSFSLAASKAVTSIS